MPSDKNLTNAYYELSSLYKNPTGPFKGVAAANQDTELDTELAKKHKRLLQLFKQNDWERGKKTALYFKSLSLLYEVDDYRGVSSVVKDLILAEHSALSEEFDLKARHRVRASVKKSDFENEKARSLCKAKILCCVAAIESRRKSSQSTVLLNELTALEEYITQNLHQPKLGYTAWTTLAFVHAAQARVARQSQMYSYMREKLLSVLRCLDESSAELIDELSALYQKGKTEEVERKIKKQVDNLVFIRRKQTLSTSFNVGLAELQRGSLRVAAYACQSARLEFRFHGHLFHRLFNELIMLSVKRAQISNKNESELLKLKDRLNREILPLLKPEGEAGNSKLYLYGLRELAVIQYHRAEYTDLLDTLNEMEQVGPLSNEWNSRINNLRARAKWRMWVRRPKDARLLKMALDYCEKAFRQASGLAQGVGGYSDVKSLFDAIKGAERISLIDVMESLITYGDIQIGHHKLPEAMKSAAVVIDLCQDNNPRLLAMGHLVMAEALYEARQFNEAGGHLERAKVLERQIDHKYVAERIRAVEGFTYMQKLLDLSSCKPEDFEKAKDLLLGWFIERHTDMKSKHSVAEDLSLHPRKIDDYLKRLKWNQDSPYHHLVFLKEKYKSKSRKKERKKG